MREQDHFKLQHSLKEFEKFMEWPCLVTVDLFHAV